MKKILIMFALISVFLTESVSAQTCPVALGKAYIPHMRHGFHNTSYNSDYNLVISNVSDVSVDVTVKYYEDDATLITDDGSSSTGIIFAAGTFSSYSDSSGITFALASQSSIKIVLSPGTSLGGQIAGYGTIEWTSTSAISEGVALIAGGAWYFDEVGSSTKQSQAGMAINGGMPF